MNYHTTQFNNSLDSYYNTIMKHKDEVMTEFNNDKEQNYTSLLTQKLSILDNLLKNIIKYKNLATKEKQLTEKAKMKNILGKSSK
jgi:hypothetical protein